MAEGYSLTDAGAGGHIRGERAFLEPQGAPDMKIYFKRTIAFLLIAGCGGSTTVTPPPAGYADGTKDVDQAGLSFNATSTGLDRAGLVSTGSLTSIGPGSQQITISNQTDPNTIIVRVDGTDYTLTGTPGAHSYSEPGVFAIYLNTVDTTVDGQARLLVLQSQGVSGDDLTQHINLAVVGMETDPAEITPLSGSATFNGTAHISVFHDRTGTASQDVVTGYGEGAVALTADFSAQTIAGVMTLAEQSSDLGYELSPATVVTINPAPITGNGFSTTLAINAADLHMSTITTTDLGGKFYGPDAANVGAVFSGSGTSATGGVPVHFLGGFVATK